ncbi:unnamed protein product, partial [Lampetra fluviatilis]
TLGPPSLTLNVTTLWISGPFVASGRRSGLSVAQVYNTPRYEVSYYTRGEEARELSPTKPRDDDGDDDDEDDWSPVSQLLTSSATSSQLLPPYPQPAWDHRRHEPSPYPPPPPNPRPPPYLQSSPYPPSPLYPQPPPYPHSAPRADAADQSESSNPPPGPSPWPLGGGLGEGPTDGRRHFLSPTGSGGCYGRVVVAEANAAAAAGDAGKNRPSRGDLFDLLSSVAMETPFSSLPRRPFVSVATAPDRVSLPESNSRAVMSALRSLQEKIRLLELERGVGRRHLEEGGYHAEMQTELLQKQLRYLSAMMDQAQRE